MRTTCLILITATVLAGCATTPTQQAGRPGASVVIVVLDGLRPDYVTRDAMPNLYALAQEGAVSERHHAIFPSVTRANATTVATGCYPARHGILGNSLYVPEASPAKSLSAASAENLLHIEDATGGNLLTVPSLGERLQAAGKTLFVASSGSSGSAMLLNHKFTGAGVAHCAMIRPDSLRERVEKKIGPAPQESAPNAGQNRWAVDAWLKVALPELRPDVAILWLSDPDHTAHEFGIGAPQTLEALRAVDAELGRVVRALHGRDANLIVMSDHGFSTYTGGRDLNAVLIEGGGKQSPESADVITAGGAIYVKGHSPDRVAEIVRFLQETPEVGVIFTAPAAKGSPQGVVPGTFSLALAHLDHPHRAPDIYISDNWSHARNRHGFRGTAASNGVAGHGSSSPYDIGAVLVAYGPHVRSGFRSPVPTGQVDILPTVFHLLGLDPPKNIDGRVLDELLDDGDIPRTVRTTVPTAVRLPSVTYRAQATLLRVNGTEYLDQARADR